MAKVIRGVLQAKTGIIIDELYPQGRQLRGACGYIALKLRLKRAERVADWKWDGVIFRDLIPISGCGRQYTIDREGRFVNCSECGDNYHDRIVKTVATKNRMYKEIKEGRKYRLEIIIVEEEYQSDIIAIINTIEKGGGRIGKMTNNGHGLFGLREWNTGEITPMVGDKWRLMSDAVMPEGEKYITAGKTVGDRHEKISLKVVSKGREINKRITGFGAGEYIGLGFGEIEIIT